MVIQDYSSAVGILSFTMQGAGSGSLGTGGPFITPNTWHHVAFTLQRTSTAAITTIYLDGAVGATLTTPWTYGNIGNPWDLLIGGDGVLAGKIAVDEVEIFKRALTSSEIQAIFNAGSAGNCKPIVHPNRSPVASAGPDQTVEATGPSGASVTLNGSGSSDPDGDQLFYKWAGTFGIVSGVSPTVTLPLGTQTVTLTVSDGQDIAIDTINITVQDTTVPNTIINSAVDGNAAAVASGGSTSSKKITFTFGGTDAVGVVGFQCKLDAAAAYAPCVNGETYSGLALGSHHLEVRALDAAGNIDPSPASFTWTVMTCAPVGSPFVVNSTADVVDASPGDGCCATADGVCTLRAAIQETNALPGPDTIGFDPVVFNSQKTILVDVNLGVLPAVVDGLTITGPGVDVVTVNANQTGSVFRITMGVVAISGLTITGGNAGAAGGGGIYSSATLTLTNVTVSANSADNGAGIYNDVGGTLVVNSSTVTVNTGGGGGIFSISVGGTVTINSSTISGNTGSGILMYHGTLILNNSTISGNVAGFGGGISTSNHSIVLKLSNSTISGNASYGDGGGIRTGGYATTYLKNTIVAGNINGGDCSLSPVGNVINSLGHNLDGDNTCKMSAPTDYHQPPLLGPLANNGGPTQTHALLTGSPAIDKGDDCLAVDQRGVLRPQGAACDIGAYEVGDACAQPPSGLIGWWPGDNHSNDIWDSNHGVLIGGVSYATGQVKQAFSFPSLSSTGFDRVGINPGPSANTFTIEAWVFANQHGPSGYRTIYANDTRGFWLKSGRLNWWSPSLGDRFVGNTVVPLGAWHHIALTYSGGTFTGYLNGVNVGTSFSPGEFLPTGNGLGIGGHNYLPEDFDGLIDELAIYNRALDVSEIQAISNAGSAGKCKPIANPNHAPDGFVDVGTPTSGTGTVFIRETLRAVTTRLASRQSGLG